MRDYTRGTTAQGSNLLARLIQIQQDRQWSDTEMADWLGVHRAHWNRVRRGIFPLAGKTVSMALARDRRKLGLLAAHRLDMMPKDGAA